MVYGWLALDTVITVVWYVKNCAQIQILLSFHSNLLFFDCWNSFLVSKSLVIWRSNCKNNEIFFWYKFWKYRKVCTVKLQVVDWSTIQFWNFLAKGDLIDGSIMAPIQLIDGYQCVFLFKTIRFMIAHCRTYLYWLCAGGSARGKRVVILRGQILVRRSGDLIDGSIMAPIQPLALGLIAALLFCYICFAFLPSAQRIYIEVFCIFCRRYGQIGISKLLFRLILYLHYVICTY